MGKYANWAFARICLIRALFIIIAASMSLMAYSWAEEFAGSIAIVVFCAFIAYDIILVPRFPNFVHYVNTVFATVASIAFMAIIGYATMGSTIASKEDSTYATLEERLETKRQRIERLDSNRAGYILSGDSEGLQEWIRDNQGRLDKLQDEYEGMLLQKQEYNEDKGGSYQDASIAPIKWMADAIGETPEVVNAYILPALWLTLLSIQSVLSAAAHSIAVHRPSIMRGVLVVMTMIFGIKHRYVENMESAIGQMENDGKKTSNGLKKAA